MAQTTLKQRQIAASNGWISFPAGTTCTYVGADDPTYTMYVSGEAQTFLSIGMKFECFQSGMKFFFITAIGAYDSGNDRTLVTLYGGTDYDLANAEVGLPAYSMVKSPYGFPMSPAKWKQTATDTTRRTQASPSNGTWYNLGSFSMSVPIGAWKLGYKVNAAGALSSGGYAGVKTTLSTANNSESDTDFGSRAFTGSGTVETALTTFVEKDVLVASKTSYYINTQILTGGGSQLANENAVTPALIWATCAYL